MLKKSGRLHILHEGSWKERWCMLEGDILKWSKKEGDSAPAYSHNLNGCRIEDASIDHRICLKISGSTISLGFENNETRRAWRSVLLIACLSSTLKRDDVQFSPSDIIASGAQARVYRANGTKLGLRQVAVKVLRIGEMQADPEALLACAREINILSDLRHPNILPVLGFCKLPPVGSECAQVWLVTELFANKSLEDHIYIPNRSTQMNQELIRLIAMDIARGMTLLHTKQIIHRDLKAGNILIRSLACDAGVNAVISDFGIARVVAQMAHDVKTAGAGTPLYMAPEVATGNYADKADVFSFAMVLWEMFYGRLIWQGCRFAWQVQEKVKEGQRPSFDETPATTCPPWMRSLIEKCWHANESRRPSFAQILEHLEGGESRFNAANDVAAMLDALKPLSESPVAGSPLSLSSSLNSPSYINKRASTNRQGDTPSRIETPPPLVGQSAPLSNPVAAVTGFLTKQAGSKRNWKRRWFELHGGMMSYSLNAEYRTTPIGVFSVRGAHVTYVNILGKQNCLCVMTTPRTWYLCADSPAERDMWLNAITSHAALQS